jgi:hypothetical protein
MSIQLFVLWAAVPHLPIELSYHNCAATTQPACAMQGITTKFHTIPFSFELSSAAHAGLLLPDLCSVTHVC